MEITERIETRTDVKAISVRLTGDYQKLNHMETWNKLGAYCRANGIDYDTPETEYINIYHDNPATTPAAECRTDTTFVTTGLYALLSTAE